MCYTEDFIKSIIVLYHDGQTQIRLSEDYEVLLHPPFIKGLKSNPKLKQRTERFLLLNKFENSLNKT